VYTYLQDRQHYEDRYNDGTVAKCRSGERIVNDTFKIMEKKLTKKELTDKPAWLVLAIQ
jgi:hypothetical protein